MGKEKIVLIDTSSWIEALRKGGDSQTRERVHELLITGKASWCDLIILELRNGARGEREGRILDDYEDVIRRLPITDEVWTIAKQIVNKARKEGLTMPIVDIVIFACASYHCASMEHCDKHYEMLLSL